MKDLKWLFFIALLTVGIYACTKDKDEPTPDPLAVTSIDPSSGKEGTTVKITGTGFGTDKDAVTVSFNGTQATVSAISSTTITTSVPTGATTGKITVKAGNETVTSSSDFTVETDPIPITPTFTEFTPTEAEEGETVTLTGTNFGTDKDAVTVSFNGKTTSIETIEDTKITVKVPAEATTGKITVKIGDTELSSDSDFTVKEAKPVATISEVSPAMGISGTSVTLTGENFGTDKDLLTIKFDGEIVATITSITDTEIVLEVPENLINVKADIIIEKDGNTSTKEDAFDVLNIPTDGLQAYYPFNGNANDESTNSNNGTVNGAVLTSGKQENAESAYKFNGTDDYIEMTGDGLNITGDALTVVTWVKTSRDTGNDNQEILGKLKDDKGYFLGLIKSEVICIVNDQFARTNIANVQANTWLCIAVVFNGVNTNIYINGEEKALKTNSITEGIVGSGSNFTIGDNNDTDLTTFLPLQGDLDNVLIYNKNLTETQIQDIYNATK